MNAARRPTLEPCPCGRPLAYAACCGRYHAGEPAPDAESLMRSRYSAYVRCDADYLLRTWHASTRPAELSLEAPAGARTVWLGLDVQRAASTGPDTAEVEFRARYRVGGGSAVRMSEHSRFVREEGQWYYLDAV
ncbi:YchJ family metal-binding protein [Stenotrophomonas sp. HITSZ_GD]|uniref:YchJ family metal-binding protein n=1 Tax=Stenotrophomonas sp. HITSZ_GD TaxID=3037248 RepID=UPI00240E6FA2|nr:YchJ family metal-binding protein [Stenotrophomonas sp. HITSZ_GD]MDG2524106.1 YchJ family metal-binding protein [Stenotrophomonas sp. HITSZ_GD]